MICIKFCLIVLPLLITITYQASIKTFKEINPIPSKNNTEREDITYSNVYISLYNYNTKPKDCIYETDHSEYIMSNKRNKSLDDYQFQDKLGYYKYYKGPARWHDALKRCEQDDAHLIILNSHDEADFFYKLINSKPKVDNPWSTFTHIGFHDQVVEGQYITIKNEPLCTSGYWSWAPGQPDNNNNNENCGSVFKPGGLNDLICTAETDFVCERDL